MRPHQIWTLPLLVLLTSACDTITNVEVGPAIEASNIHLGPPMYSTLHTGLGGTNYNRLSFYGSAGADAAVDVVSSSPNLVQVRSVNRSAVPECETCQRLIWYVEVETQANWSYFGEATITIQLRQNPTEKSMYKVIVQNYPQPG